MFPCRSVPEIHLNVKQTRTGINPLSFESIVHTKPDLTDLHCTLVHMSIVIPTLPAISATLMTAGQRGLAWLNTGPGVWLTVTCHESHVTAYRYLLFHFMLTLPALLPARFGTRVVGVAHLPRALFHTPVKIAGSSY